MSRSIQIGPDLVLSVFAVPATGSAGGVISVSDTILNQGGGTAAASTTTFYLSANGVIGAGDTLLGSRNVPALAAGATNLATTTLTIPPTTGVGVYYILANADANGAVVETIEINNVFGRIIQIGGDLAVSALTVPATGAAGSTIVATDTTRNVGGGSVAASATRFYLSSNALHDAGDILLGGRDVPSLGAGITNSGSTTLPIPASTAPGAYYIIAKADAADVVPELYETNNTAARLFQVGSDLVISAMTVPAVGAPGGAVTVTETTSNQGTGLAPPSVTRFYLSMNAVLDASDQVLPPLRQVPELAGNTSSAGSTVVTIPAGTAPGAYYIIARADADNSVTETNETNNVLWRLIQIGGDLVVSAFTVPTKGGAGLTITVTDTTTNQGSGALPATVTKIYFSSNVTYEAADTLLGSRPVPQLAAGASSSGSTSVTIPAGVGTGTYFVLARTDADAAAVETQEANNVLARGIQIGSDIWVTTMTVPLKAAAGSSIVVTETTVNQGGGTSTPSVTRFYLSADGSIGAGDTLLEGSRTVPGLAPGAASTASTTVLIPEGAAPGTHYLIAKADADNAVAETLETNNTRSHSMSVGPDLVVASVTVSATTVAAGSAVNVTDTVTNQGAGAASASVTRFYLSQNIVLDGGDISLAASRAVPDIAGGASNSGTTSVTIPASTSPGSYFLLSIADGYNSVTEYLETNNAAPRAIQVTLAP
jgi:subtilase family serine protease